MGSLKKITECVTAHVPEGRCALAESALAVLADLCHWIDVGGRPLERPVDTERLLSSLRPILGVEDDLYVSRYFQNDPRNPVMEYSLIRASEKLASAFLTANVPEELAEAIPWMMQSALWQHVLRRIEAFVPEALRPVYLADCIAVETMIKTLTHAYVLAVIGDDQRAMAALKPVLRAMPSMVLVGIASHPGQGQMAAFLRCV